MYPHCSRCAERISIAGNIRRGKQRPKLWRENWPDTRRCPAAKISFPGNSFRKTDRSKWNEGGDVNIYWRIYREVKLYRSFSWFWICFEGSWIIYQIDSDVKRWFEYVGSFLFCEKYIFGSSDDGNNFQWWCSGGNKYFFL